MKKIYKLIMLVPMCLLITSCAKECTYDEFVAHENATKAARDQLVVTSLSFLTTSVATSEGTDSSSITMGSVINNVEGDYYLYTYTSINTVSSGAIMYKDANSYKMTTTNDSSLTIDVAESLVKESITVTLNNCLTFNVWDKIISSEDNKETTKFYTDGEGAIVKFNEDNVNGEIKIDRYGYVSSFYSTATETKNDGTKQKTKTTISLSINKEIKRKTSF